MASVRADRRRYERIGWDAWLDGYDKSERAKRVRELFPLALASFGPVLAFYARRARHSATRSASGGADGDEGSGAHARSSAAIASGAAR